MTEAFNPLKFSALSVLLVSSFLLNTVSKRGSRFAEIQSSNYLLIVISKIKLLLGYMIISH